MPAGKPNLSCLNIVLQRPLKEALDNMQLPIILSASLLLTAASAWMVPTDIPDRIYIDGRDNKAREILRSRGSAFDLSSDARSIPLPRVPDEILANLPVRKADELKRALHFRS